MSYDLTFWYNPFTGSPSELDVYWDGSLVTTLVNIFPQGYNQYTFTGLLATSAATVLQFNGRQDPLILRLDDVAVNASAAPIPEPGSGSLLLATIVGMVGFGLRRRRIRP